MIAFAEDRAVAMLASWFVPSCPSLVVRGCAELLAGQIDDLQRALASGGGGIDREPAVVLRELSDFAVQLNALAGAMMVAEEP